MDDHQEEFRTAKVKQVAQTSPNVENEFGHSSGMIDPKDAKEVNGRRPN
jgi:hypothetical protein